MMKMDWSPRSRTSNPHSTSPEATPRPLDYGKGFATGGRGAGSSGRCEVVEGSRLTDKASRPGPLDRLHRVTLDVGAAESRNAPALSPSGGDRGRRPPPAAPNPHRP